MADVIDRVMEEALGLPADARIRLVERLLASLNLPSSAEIDRLWAEEAERRVSDIESGAAKPVPGDVVFARVRAKHEK